MPDNRSAVVESRGESKTVPVAAIAANPWNYNVQSDAAFTKLAESMRRFGFVEPVVVRKKGVGYEIINGEHRWRAAKLLAMTEIPIVDLGEMDDAKAKQLTIILNELGGAPDEVRLAELLKDIGSSTSFSDLASVMPYSDRELQMYIEAVDFSFDNLSGADINPKDAEGKDTEGNYSFGEPNLPAVKTEGVSGPELRRISFRLSPDEAKALVAGLKKIHADPVVALRTAVEVAVKAAKAAA